MESYLKDQWYQLEEQYREAELKDKKQHKTNATFRKLQPILDKKNKDKYINTKRRKAKKVGNIVFEFI
jgi:hypothetical protein